MAEIRTSMQTGEMVSAFSLSVRIQILVYDGSTDFNPNAAI